MTTRDPVARLLAGVARRERLARIARVAAVTLVAVAGVQLAAVLAVRLTGLAADPFGWSTLALPPLAALAVALLAARPRPARHAARLADAALGADDLFATAVDAGAPGEYRPLVRIQAEAAATSATPARVVPWRPARRLGIAAASLAVLALATALVPQLDPFGRQERRDRASEQAKRLERERREAKKLIEELRTQQPEAALSPEVAAELKKLEAMLDAMKPAEIPGNRTKLDEARQALSAKLEQERADRFAQSLPDDGEQQQRLGGDPAAAQALKKQLERGETAEGEQRLEELKSMAEQLAKATTPQERAKLAQAMREKLETLEKGAKGQPAGFSQAVKQALDQLARSGDQDLREQSLQALRDTLDLATLEMQSGAQDARDLEAMQEALQALHLAKQLNEQGGLDGEGASGAEGMEAYKKKFAEMMKGRGQGQGEGQGGGPGNERGEGDGSTRPIDDSGTSAFNPEQARSQLSAGKTLMQWKAHGPSETGTVEQDYLPAVRAVQQGVSEALVKEQVPPGYHDGVKEYFDGIEPGR